MVVYVLSIYVYSNFVLWFIVSLLHCCFGLPDLKIDAYHRQNPPRRRTIPSQSPQGISMIQTEASDCAPASACAPWPAATWRVVVDKQPVAGWFLHLAGSVKVQCALLGRWILSNCLSLNGVLNPARKQQVDSTYVPDHYRSYKIWASTEK